VSDSFGGTRSGLNGFENKLARLLRFDWHADCQVVRRQRLDGRKEWALATPPASSLPSLLPGDDARPAAKDRHDVKRICLIFSLFQSSDRIQSFNRHKCDLSLGGDWQRDSR
jgi:hypothetical protein